MTTTPAFPVHGQFTKLPVTIEAYRLPAAGEDVPDSFHEWADRVGFIDFECDRDEGMLITTLEGQMRADPGDWIIKGVKGEFYPCKDEIFRATYRTADDVVTPGGGLPGDHNGENAAAAPKDWLAIEKAISEFIDDFEMHVEDASGVEGTYTPTEFERTLINDAILGVLADSDILEMLGARSLSLAYELPQGLNFTQRMELAARHGQKATAEFALLVNDAVSTFMSSLSAEAIAALRAERSRADTLPNPMQYVTFPSEKHVWHLIATALSDNGLSQSLALDRAMQQVAEGVMRGVHVPDHCKGPDAQTDQKNGMDRWAMSAVRVVINTQTPYVHMLVGLLKKHEAVLGDEVVKPVCEELIRLDALAQKDADEDHTTQAEMSMMDVWIAAGGSPDKEPTPEIVLEALGQMAAMCDQIAMPIGLIEVQWQDGGSLGFETSFLREGFELQAGQRFHFYAAPQEH